MEYCIRLQTLWICHQGIRYWWG